MTDTNLSPRQSTAQSFDMVCFSHLRWDFVYQRPQHLMSRFARGGRVFFIEEPLPGEGPAYIDVSQRDDKIRFVVAVEIVTGNGDGRSVHGIL